MTFNNDEEELSLEEAKQMMDEHELYIKQLIQGRNIHELRKEMLKDIKLIRDDMAENWDEKVAQPFLESADKLSKTFSDHGLNLATMSVLAKQWLIVMRSILMAPYLKDNEAVIKSATEQLLQTFKQ